MPVGAANMADEQAICTVINEQFDMEVAYKEEELQRIDDRIQLAKMMLHRLRLGILAQQYGLSGFYMMEDYSKENVGMQASWNSFESEFLSSRQEEQQQEKVEAMKDGGGEGEAIILGKREGSIVSEKREESTPEVCDRMASAVSSAVSSQVPSEAGDDDSDAAVHSQPMQGPSGEKKLSSLLNDKRRDTCRANGLETSVMPAVPSAALDEESLKRGKQSPTESTSYSTRLPASLSRFATKKRIIVGNTSQFLDPSARSTIDGSTHKWMVYVRGSSEDPDIASFVKAVRFFLHPSYHPNDIIRIPKPPFHLTRYGWGEFPVRVQLEFTDKRNKHVDIIHNMVLDRTHTGHQTLGSETIVDLDLLSAESVMYAGARAGDVKRESVLKNNSMHPFRALNNVKQRSILKTESGCSGVSAESESSYIHHIFLPASCSADQVALDHNYAQIVVVSRRPGPAHTPTGEGMDTHESEVGSEGKSEDPEPASLDEFLHSMVKATPLCGPESSGFHLVAPSIEHFKKWNIGRRRAAEWMRALAMKRLIEMQESPIPMCASLTTKQVMEWCRKNGYTPLDPAALSGRGFCKYCGCQLTSSWGRGEEGAESERNSHTRCSEVMEIQLGRGREGRRQQQEEEEDEEEEDEESYSSSEEESGEEEEREAKRAVPSTVGQRFSTLSTPFQLFESLVAKDRELRVLKERREGEQVVDVVTVPTQQRQIIEPVPRFRVPQTPELKWVQQTAAAIGIPIYPAVIDRMYAHVVEHMIYMACTKFARAILDHAVNESAQQVESDSSEERCLVPLHIYRAVKNLQSCDFLTNSFLGLPTLDTAAAESDDNRIRDIREE